MNPDGAEVAHTDAAVAVGHSAGGDAHDSDPVLTHATNWAKLKMRLMPEEDDGVVAGSRMALFVAEQ